MRALSSRLGALAIALLVVGCGESSPEVLENSPIPFASPAVRADGVISPRVRCGAGTIWLPVRWGALPDGTREVALYIGRYKRTGEGVRVTFGAMVTRIEPAPHAIPANTLPVGSVPASFNTSYSCPSARRGQNVLVALFALDHAPRVARGSLDAGFVTGLTEEALGLGRFAGDSEAVTPFAAEALAVGRFTATYGAG